MKTSAIVTAMHASGEKMWVFGFWSAVGRCCLSRSFACFPAGAGAAGGAAVAPSSHELRDGLAKSIGSPHPTQQCYFL